MDARLSPCQRAVYDLLSGGELVTKDEIASLWGAAGASDELIATILSHIRARRPGVDITCYAGQGYRMGEAPEGFSGPTIREGATEIRLSPTQRRVVEALWGGKVIPSPRMQQIVGGSYNTMKVTISHLRAKLAAVGMGVEYTRDEGYRLR